MATVAKVESKQYQLGDINPANIQQLRTLNMATLPVRYSDKFYRELTINYAAEYLKYAVWNGFVVAAVCARVETEEAKPEEKKLYIMTINVLAAYRRRGIATELLKHVLETAEKDTSIKEVYLHVQISNLEAKQFYLKYGFEEVDIIRGYYKNIDPPDCFLLKKLLHQA